MTSIWQLNTMLKNTVVGNVKVKKWEAPRLIGERNRVEDRHIYNCFNILFSKNNNRNKRSGNYKGEGLIMIKKTGEETDR